ncbi:hypothetical protein KW807_02150 [Candidatus Parcubacteria bacterium]|nr:hypothetical protein [Candidatus Parcubacteria bacterium]
MSTSSPALKERFFLLVLTLVFLATGSLKAASIDLTLGTEYGLDNSIQTVESREVDVVEVRSKDHGHLLALVPVDLNVTVRAHADGTVEVIYPWYSVLTVDNKEDLETQVKIAVDNALRAEEVGRVRAEGEVINPTFSTQSAAHVRAEIEKVLKSVVESKNELTTD